MSNVSVSLPSDGTTADVADYNTPINTIVNEFNGNIDNSNIKSGAAISTSKLADDAGITTAKITDGAITPAKLTAGTGTTWAWQSWTPTFTGLTVGNGTLDAKYIQVGKTIHFKMKFTLGSTSSVAAASDLIFTLPATSTSDYVQYYSPLGGGTLKDASGSSYPATVNWYSTTQAVFQRFIVSGSNIILDNVDSDEPFTWVSTDSLYAQGTYEVA